MKNTQENWVEVLQPVGRQVSWCCGSSTEAAAVEPGLGVGEGWGARPGGAPALKHTGLECTSQERGTTGRASFFILCK